MYVQYVVFFPFSYRCHLYPHPENHEERADVMDSLLTRIQDLNNVGQSSQNIHNMLQERATWGIGRSSGQGDLQSKVRSPMYLYPRA